MTPPPLMSNLHAVAPLLRARRLGVVVDFDGTISQIAPTPDEARVWPQAASALRSLSRKLALVAVMSGRAASDVAGLVGVDGLAYLGNHGAETLRGGRLDLAPDAESGRYAVARAFAALRDAVSLPGMVWQDKGLSASAHYRLSPDPQQAERALRDALRRVGPIPDVEAFWGKMVLELRAGNGPNKGAATRELASRHALDGLLFVGDGHDGRGRAKGGAVAGVGRRAGRAGRGCGAPGHAGGRSAGGGLRAGGRAGGGAVPGVAGRGGFLSLVGPSQGIDTSLWIGVALLCAIPSDSR